MALGRDTITQRIALEGGDEIKKQLAELGDTGEKAVKQIKDAAEESQSGLAGLSAIVARVREGFGQVSQALTPAYNNFRAIGESVGTLVGNIETAGKNIAWMTAGVTAAAVGVYEFARSANQAIIDTQNMAANLGLSTSDFEALQLAASAAGVDVQRFNTSLLRFSQNIGAAAIAQANFTANLSRGVAVLRGGVDTVQTGVGVLRGASAGLAESVQSGVMVLRGNVAEAAKSTNAAAAALQMLKINVLDASGAIRPNAELLAEVAQRLMDIRDPALRDKLALDLFGRGWRDMMPVLRDGVLVMANARDAFARLGIQASDAEEAQARVFMGALQTMKTAIDETRKIVGSILGAALVPLFQAVTQLLSQNIEAIRAWAQRAAAAVSDVVETMITGMREASQSGAAEQVGRGALTFFQAVRDAGPIVLAAFRGLLTALDMLAGAVNAVFGTNTNGLVLAFALVMLKLSGILPVIISSFSVLGTLVATFGGQLVALIATGATPWTLIAAGIALVILALVALVTHWDEVKAKAQEVYDWFVGTWVEVGNQMAANWNANMAGLGAIFTAFGGLVRDTISSVVQFFVDMWNWAVQWVEGLWSGLVSWVAGAAQSILSALQPVWDFLKTLADLMGSVLGSAPSVPAAGYARGGPVWGPGTATSDSVSARLSAGEWVMRAAAVRHYGQAFMAAINALRFPRIDGFSMGGLVRALSALPAPVASFANGGPVLAPASAGAAGSVINLTIGAETFEGLLAPQATADRLVRFARGRRVRSAGRKPGWYGGG